VTFFRVIFRYPLKKKEKEKPPLARILARILTFPPLSGGAAKNPGRTSTKKWRKRHDFWRPGHFQVEQLFLGGKSRGAGPIFSGFSGFFVIFFDFWRKNTLEICGLILKLWRKGPKNRGFYHIFKIKNDGFLVKNDGFLVKNGPKSRKMGQKSPF